MYIPYENWRFPNWLKSHLSLASPFINTMYVTTWSISKRGNKWEILSYEAWMDGRTAVGNNKSVFWRTYKNEWPISWNYEYIIFGQIIFQNFHQFKAFVGLSDRRIIATAPYLVVWGNQCCTFLSIWLLSKRQFAATVLQSMRHHLYCSGCYKCWYYDMYYVWCVTIKMCTKCSVNV